MPHPSHELIVEPQIFHTTCYYFKCNLLVSCCERIWRASLNLTVIPYAKYNFVMGRKPLDGSGE